jgi:site-specific recombinase XerD
MGKKEHLGPPVAQSTETTQLKRKPRRKILDDSLYLIPEEIRALFEVIEKQRNRVRMRRDRAIFRIVYHHGLRIHEVRRLQLADFRDRDGLLYIYRGKGSISRQHKLVPEALRCLRAYVREGRGAEPGALFPSRQGSKGISPRRIQQLFLEYCGLAAIPLEKAHPHALKHSCGTHLAERGEHPQVIQDWLGHRDPASTEIYMHFSSRRREQAHSRQQDWK